jgi:hypothetical protein
MFTLLIGGMSMGITVSGIIIGKEKLKNQHGIDKNSKRRSLKCAAKVSILDHNLLARRKVINDKSAAM